MCIRDRVNAQAEDSLQNIRVVQSFTGEAAESEKFRRANERFCDSRKDIYAHESYLYTGVEALTQLMTASVVVLGGLCITGGSLSLPGLITFILYTGYLVEPIPRLAQLSKMYQEAFAGFGRFMDILETEPAIRDRPDVYKRQIVDRDLNICEFNRAAEQKFGIPRAEALKKCLFELMDASDFQFVLETVSYTHLDVYKRQQLF